MSVLIAAVAEVLKFETAVLLILAAGLLVLAKSVSDLRAEVRGLRGGKSADSQAPQPVAPSSVPAAPAASDEIPADVFAAIVSAVHYTLGDGHHVVSVSPAESLAWSREGRRSIFRSHSPR
ncbi:MAG: hypothetical protein ACOYM3_00970 [Terrimicrobiaceae bacterium]